MAVMAEYRILSVPRLAPSEMDLRLYDALVGQRALWNHLALHLIRDHQVTVELRLIRRPMGIGVSLRLHGDPTPEALERIAQTEALLPTEYRWQQAEPDLSLDQLQMRMARVVRRVEFVDLPIPNAQMDSAAGAATLFGGPRSFAGVAPAEIDDRRCIPDQDTATVELLTARLCLPFPGRMDELKPRQKLLFQHLLRSYDAVVSVCVHPVAAAVQAESRKWALNWKRFLDPLATEVAKVGFGEIQDIRGAYDRFGLPPGYLTHVSIRVGAPDDKIAVGLANALCASLGGARAFQVSPPSRFVTGDALFDRNRDMPTLMSRGALANQRSTLLRELHNAHIKPVETAELLDFVIGAPHMFTLEEAEQILRLPLADDEGLPGIESEAIPPFNTPSLDFLPTSLPDRSLTPPPANRVRIGMVRKPGATVFASNGERLTHHAWHTIDPIDLTKHALIVGSTGSGKTMSTSFLVRELHRLKIPITVIEPVKTEYYQRLKGRIAGLKRFRFEGSASGGPGSGFLIFDPLRIQAHTSVARHCSYLKSCFEAAFPMNDFFSLLMENALLEYYTAPRGEGGCGLGKFSRGGPEIGRIEGQHGTEKVFPSFATFKDFLLGPFLAREFASGGRGGANLQEMKEAFRRRMINLGASVLGESFKLADQIYIRSRGDPAYYDVLNASVLTGFVVVELDAIPDADQKALVMALLMTYLFERRQAEDLHVRENGLSTPHALRHFLIVEEAHRLLAAGGAGERGGESVGLDSRAKAVSLFVDMLAEIRAYGQGLAIVEQIPTKIVPEAVKNTNLKIMLRLTAKDDREYLGEAMNFTEAQMRFVMGLKVERPRPREGRDGQINFVVFDEGLEQPLPLSLPLSLGTGGTTVAPADWLYDEFF